MAISEAESIRSKIEDHSHLYMCFNGSDYDTFRKKTNILYRIRNCYNGINNYERYITDIYSSIRYKENEKNNQNDLFRRKLQSIKNENENSLNVEIRRKENEIQEMKNELDIYRRQCESHLNLINEDISNLQKEIKELNIAKNDEIELSKKEKLYELKNEFKLDLLRYKNKKELETKLMSYGDYNKGDKDYLINYLTKSIFSYNYHFEEGVIHLYIDNYTYDDTIFKLDTGITNLHNFVNDEENLLHRTRFYKEGDDLVA